MDGGYGRVADHRLKTDYNLSIAKIKKLIIMRYL